MTNDDEIPTFTPTGHTLGDMHNAGLFDYALVWDEGFKPRWWHRLVPRRWRPQPKITYYGGTGIPSVAWHNPDSPDNA